MSVYKVPFQFEHEEKMFGGYLSLRQMLYVLFSVVSIGILFIHGLPIMLKLILFLITFGMLMTFAFLKIGNIYADKYFINIIKFIFRKKTFIK